MKQHQALAAQLVATGMLEDLQAQVREDGFIAWANITAEQAADGADQRERDKLQGRLDVIQMLHNMALDPDP